MGVETIALVTALASAGSQVYSSKQQRKAEKSQLRAQNQRLADEKAAIAKEETTRVEKEQEAVLQSSREKKVRMAGGFGGLASSGRNRMRRQGRGFLSGQSTGRFGV